MSSGSESDGETTSVSPLPAKRNRRKRVLDSPSTKEQKLFADMKNSKSLYYQYWRSCNIGYYSLEKIEVKCNQSGLVFKTSVDSLSLEDGEPLTDEDLKPGSQVLADWNKKSYIVTVMKIVSNDRKSLPSIYKGDQFFCFREEESRRKKFSWKHSKKG